MLYLNHLNKEGVQMDGCVINRDLSIKEQLDDEATKRELALNSKFEEIYEKLIFGGEYEREFPYETINEEPITLKSAVNLIAWYDKEKEHQVLINRVISGEMSHTNYRNALAAIIAGEVAEEETQALIDSRE